MKKNIEIKTGWGNLSIENQLLKQGFTLGKSATYYDKANESITNLWNAGLLTNKQACSAEKKLIMKAVMYAEKLDSQSVK